MFFMDFIIFVLIYLDEHCIELLKERESIGGEGGGGLTSGVCGRGVRVMSLKFCAEEGS